MKLRWIVLTLAMAFTCVQRMDGACCYFAAQDKDINQPGQKAFITWDPAEGVESFTVQPKFEGNALDFGMVIPTPSRPKLDEMPRDFFKDLAIYTILLPLPQPIHTDLLWELRVRERMTAGGSAGGGGGIRGSKKGGVVVLEAGVIGSLDYKIISADDASALFAWLKDNRYSYAGDESALDYYVQKGWLFTVMKIDPKQMKKNPDGSYLGEVTPTRLAFASKECIYPLKITQISVRDKTDALLYVQAPAQMDLVGDWSWMHSWRVMYLTFMLGCGATPEEQQEVQQRNQWVTAKKRADPNFETTKLEWAKKLGDEEMAVLEDPLANYAQMGGALPPGATAIPLPEFLAEAWAAYEKLDSAQRNDQIARARLAAMEQEYAADQGRIVKFAQASGGFVSPYMWYANREAPAEEVKGLARLKGHMQKGRWLTKFRKQIRKDEMSVDLVLVPVDAGKEQEYVRIMPTSPP